MKITPSPRLRAEMAWRRTIADSLTPSAEVGSSRIRTRAPKYSARAIASVWRSPPDSVPTSWSVSRTSIPMFFISSRAIRAALSLSNRLNGPNPLVGSLPRKKLRLMLISGITDRSW